MRSGVLFITPQGTDRDNVAGMLAPLALAVDSASSLREANAKLAGRRYSVVLTAADLPDGSWRDVLELTRDGDEAPAVVVTDRLVNDSIWAEVLNLGAYDLLAQPFDAEEVRRIVESAAGLSCGPGAALAGASVRG